MLKKIGYAILIIIALAIFAVVVRFVFSGPEDTWICQNNVWVKHGNPSVPSPTSGCGNQNAELKIGRDGKLSDLVEVTIPKIGETIKSPLQVTGRAPGNWFFEATAPMVVVDWDGKIVGQSHITAEGDWMTTNLVNFYGTIEYTIPTDIYSKRGSLILMRDNPSGLPDNDAGVEIPINFQ